MLKAGQCRVFGRNWPRLVLGVYITAFGRKVAPSGSVEDHRCHPLDPASSSSLQEVIAQWPRVVPLLQGTIFKDDNSGLPTVHSPIDNVSVSR
jgi:hypothetical protein